MALKSESHLPLREGGAELLCLVLSVHTRQHDEICCVPVLQYHVHSDKPIIHESACSVSWLPAPQPLAAVNNLTEGGGGQGVVDTDASALEEPRG